MMPILWENYSGSGLGLRIYIFRILDSILQPMHAGWYPGLWRERTMWSNYYVFVEPPWYHS